MGTNPKGCFLGDIGGVDVSMTNDFLSSTPCEK
jgi:hypothetical protein